MLDNDDNIVQKVTDESDQLDKIDTFLMKKF